MRTFAAIYYDGATSTPRAVQVHVEGAQDVRVRGVGIDLRFSRAELRIAPRLGDTPRAISLPDGRKLETKENDAVDALARLSGGGAGAALIHRLEKSWPLAVGAAVVVIAVLAAGAIRGIPLGARLVAENVPDELAHRVGDDSMALLDETLFDPSMVDGQTRARVEGIFRRLADLHPDLPLRLELRAMGAPNAFALPNGTVVVTDELIELAEADGEIAAVIAHEIGHVRHRHGLRMVLESSSVAILVSVYLGDASQFSSLLAALPAMYSQAGYSRAHETEADGFALALLDRARIEPRHFATILRRIGEAVGGEPDGALQYLASHPPTEARVARFERR